jgi:hypothetical protein
MDAGQHLDEGRLARAVLPHQRMDLARPQPERDAAQRRHAVELLVDAGELEHRRVGRCGGVHLFLL